MWFDFLLAMTTKEIRARYKNAIMGFLWILINPIMQMVVIGLVFQYFIRFTEQNYYLYIFSGLLAWEFFSYSISKVTQSIVFERTLIKKAHFPREAIVLSIILSNAFHMVVSYLLFIFILGAYQVLFSSVSPITSIVQSILIVAKCMPYIVLLIMFCSGVGLFASALNVKYRDVNFMVKAILPVWFYATPVIYQLSMLPEKISNFIFQYNPMVFILEGIRSSILNYESRGVVFNIIPMTIIIVVFTVGLVVFKNRSKTFDDWL